MRRKGVSTALATIAIISVLILGMSWMAYTVILNAQQQAAAAGRGETVALKAKELIRVYIWLDPARQADGRYLNLTRISFVNEWSGETVINGLLIAYNSQPAEIKQANIRLGAGERKTYLPSELGMSGLDNYAAFLARVKYIQAHTSLGNDFVSLWGEPGKPALYVTGTTRTDTYTVTTTSTTLTGTTTTTSVTRTSYTTTVTITTTIYEQNPYMYGVCRTDDPAGFPFAVTVSFRPGSWGNPPYRMIVQFVWYTNNVEFGRETAQDTTNGEWGNTFYFSPNTNSYTTLIVTFTAVDAGGSSATITFSCSADLTSRPPGTGTTGNGTTGTGPGGTTTETGTVTVWVTETVTTFVVVGGVTVTATSTYTSFVGDIVTVTTTGTLTSTEWVTATWREIIDKTITIVGNQYPAPAIIRGGGICLAGDGDLKLVGRPATAGDYWRPLVEAALVAGVLFAGRGVARDGRRSVLSALVALIVAAVFVTSVQTPAYGQVVTQTTTVTTTITNTGGTYTRTVWVTTTVNLGTQTVTQTQWVTQTVTRSTFVTVYSTHTHSYWQCACCCAVLLCDMLICEVIE